MADQTIASLMAELGFDPREFMQGMANASKANAEFIRSFQLLQNEMQPAEKATREMTVATVALGTTIGNLAADKLKALGGAFQDWAEKATNTAATVERLRGVAGYLGGAAGKTREEIDKLASSLVKQGITTRQSYDALIQMSRASLDLSKATDLATVAQNTARLTGESSSDTLTRLIHGIQTLQTDSLRYAGITIQLDTAYKTYADSVKKSVTQLSAQEKQQAALNAVLLEGNKYLGVYGVTNEFVAGRQLSLVRVQEEASVAIGQKLIPALRTYIDMQTEFFTLVKEYPDFFLALGSALTAFATGAAAYKTAMFLNAEATTAFLTGMNLASVGGVALAGVLAYTLVAAVTGVTDPMEQAALATDVLAIAFSKAKLAANDLFIQLKQIEVADWNKVLKGISQRPGGFDNPKNMAEADSIIAKQAKLTAEILQAQGISKLINADIEKLISGNHERSKVGPQAAKTPDPLAGPSPEALAATKAMAEQIKQMSGQSAVEDLKKLAAAWKAIPEAMAGKSIGGTRMDPTVINNFAEAYERIAKNLPFGVMDEGFEKLVAGTEKATKSAEAYGLALRYAMAAHPNEGFDLGIIPGGKKTFSELFTSQPNVGASVLRNGRFGPDRYLGEMDADGGAYSSSPDKKSRPFMAWAGDLGAALQQAESLASLFSGKFQSALRGASSLIGGFGSLFGGRQDKDGNDIGSTIGNLFKGKEIFKNLSSAIPAIAAMAGPIMGAISSWFENRKLAKIGEEAGQALGMSVSKEAAKAIQQKSKDLGVSIGTAALLSLPTIMGEKGSRDARTYTDQIMKLMDGIKSGAVPAAEGVKALGQSFAMLADAAKKAGTIGDSALIGVLKAARSSGGSVYTDEMKSYTKEKLSSATEGITKFIAGMIKIKDYNWQDVGSLSANMFMAGFLATSAEEGWPAAIAQYGESGTKLIEALKKSLGDDSAAQALLAPFEKFSAYMNDESLAGMLEAVSGIKQAMVGLADAGYLSNETFSAMQATTYALFTNMVSGGMASADALLAIAPNIQAAINAAEQFGIPLDANTQKLKEQAEQAGITFSTDPMMRMVNALEAIARGMGFMASEADRTGAALDANFNKTYNTRINTIRSSTNDTGVPGPPPGGGINGDPDPGVDHFAASGFYSASMPYGPRAGGMTTIGVHPGEKVSVVPAGQNRPSSSAPSIQIGDVHIHASSAQGGREAADAFLDQLAEGLKSGGAGASKFRAAQFRGGR